MVLQKRLSYGSSSYQVPAMPYVPRSARGKRSVRKKIKDNQMCAFDLLASVAGRLLSERENSVAPLNSPETLSNDVIKETIIEALDQQSCNNRALGFDFINKGQIDYESKDTVDVLGGILDSSVSVKTNMPDKYVNAEESAIDEPYEFKGGIKTPLRAEVRVANNIIDGNIADMYSSEDPMELDTKPPPLISSDSSAEVPVYSNNLTRKSSFIKNEEEVELSIAKDDDENSSGCTHPSIPPNKAYRIQRIGDRRIRKLLASRHWKLAPGMAQDSYLSDCDVKPNFLGKKMFYTRQRTQRSSFKKKLFDRRSASACDGGLNQKGVFNLFEKTGIKSEANEDNANLRGANGALPSTSGENLCHKPSKCHVQLSIKSFKVPELFIEVPENATVGSLKRTVMETLTALLGGGLRVGVLLQGKKIRDDSQSLRQVGLSHTDKIDCLGFTLEPNSIQAPAVITAPEDPHLPSICQPLEPLDRKPPIDPPANNGAQYANPPLILNLCPESDNCLVHSPTDALQPDKAPVESQALVIVPPVNSEALAMVPSRKPRRSEVGQRRIRRPFTVAEVEALVQAVEKLGTGRWRDVKLRAFDNAKHRTYVDLKDKWKTLVHTARISPQQRRGEPVPQELLDRVLIAHAYWSQQQVKLQAKPPQPATPAAPCLLH